MQKSRMQYFGIGILGVVLAVVMAFPLACAAPEPTPTPVPPAPPAPPAAPTAVPTPTAVVAPGTPTPLPLVPTPTRTVPTPTPVVAAKLQYGGTLRFAAEGTADTLDPHHTVSAYTYQPMFTIYDGLVRLDINANIVPYLAESWDFTPDGKAITFRLRKGVKFQDGTPFNAQAVKWNFDRIADPAEFSARKGEISPYIRQVQVVDENTVTMHFFAPYRPFLSQLASERIRFLVSPAAVAKYGGGKTGNYGRNPVGAGAFQLERWTLGEAIVVRKNDSYWDKGKPYLDRIVFQEVPGADVKLAMLRTGETDLVPRTSTKEEYVPLVERDPKLQVIRLKGASTPMLFFNSVRPPFDNKALRQAISYAIDREKFVKAMIPGSSVRVTPIAMGWASNPDLKPIGFDLAKAKQKLIEAGYPGGATIPLGCWTTGYRVPWCDAIQALLKEAGIKAEPVLILEAYFYENWDKVGLVSASFAQRVDPHLTVHRSWHSQGFYQGGTHYKDPELDRLMDEAATVYDTAKAKLLYDKIQTIIAGDALVVIMAWQDTFMAMSKAVQGFVPYPSGFEETQDTWLQR